MRRVVHVGYEHSAQDVRIFLKECQALSTKYETHYITANKHDEASTKTINGVRISVLPVCERRGVVRVLKYLSDAYQLCASLDADIYHIHEYCLIPLGKKLLRKGKRVIYDMHEFNPETFALHFPGPEYMKALVEKITRTYEKRFIARTNGLVCAVPDHLDEMKGLQANTILLLNYPTFENIFFSKEEFLTREANFCYTGILSEERGLMTAIPAFSGVQATFLLAGSSSEQLRTAMEQLDGWENVRYVGLLDRQHLIEEVWKQSIGGLVTFLPLDLYKKAIPNKLFEYMAAGIVPIASNHEKWREMFESFNCCIFVDPTDPAEIRSAITFLANNREDAYEMGQRGQRAVVEKFNFQAQVPEFLSFYEKALQGGKE